VVSGRVHRLILLALVLSLASPVFQPAVAQKMPTLEPREGFRVGDRAIDFTVKDIEGKTHRLSDLRGRSIVHLVFWATWCMPCIEEVPRLEAAYQQYHAQGFEVLGVVVTMNQTKEGVRAFAEKNGVQYPLLWDGDTKVMSRYRVDAIPQNFLIDRDGIIRYTATSLPGGYEELVAKMLATQATPSAAGQ
jgi:peroxiredoxin